MPKRNAKPGKHSSAYDDDELPDEIDFSNDVYRLGLRRVEQARGGEAEVGVNVGENGNDVSAGTTWER